VTNPIVSGTNAHAQRMRAAELLNRADTMLDGKTPSEMPYDEREVSYYLTMIADSRIQLARALDGH
jgi:hypothetical protein